uniref:Uncharacterized protein n=1 Tax=viral metagenome TaxID=1070528 RepID=A0A6C0ECR0_9ZZZZ
MDKFSLIKLYSCDNKNLNIFSDIHKLLKNFLEYNEINLINLNKLNSNNNYNFWNICNNTGQIYNIKIMYNNKITNTINPNNILSKINRYLYFEIILKLSEKIILKDIYLNNYIKLLDKYYIINDIDINKKTINNITIASKKLKYIDIKNINIQTSDSSSPQVMVKNNNLDDKSIDRKRKTDDLSSYRINKKQKVESNIIIDDKKINWDMMVSASAIRNYMLDDPLLDYLHEYNILSLDHEIYKQSTEIQNFIFSEKKINNNFFCNNVLIKKNIRTNHTNNNFKDIFTKSILEAGNEFEKELINILKKNHTIIKVAEFIHFKDISKVNETIDLMKQGIPIIYQGLLYNLENNTFGFPDLIVRSDYLNELLEYDVISDDEAKIPSPNLNINFHYKIIDIKHSNIKLKADGIHITNYDNINAYKGQIYIYICALNKILGIDIKKGFIWGKKYNYETKGTKYEITNFINKLGVIDYDNTDDSKCIDKTLNAIEWVKSVRSEGKYWKLLPIPYRSELFPNMNNEKDTIYRYVKEELNKNIYEITNIWHCGVKQREFAHKNNIFSWNDKNCNSASMGLNKNKTSDTIDAILDINRQNIDIIRPSKINFERNLWINPKSNEMEFYLDFETLNSNFGSIIKDGIISYDNNQYIFMIGVGFAIKNKWIFKTFIMNNKSNLEETNMFSKFNTYINKILKDNKKKVAKFYHWSSAEPIAYNNFKNRNINFKINDSHYLFYDLNKVFISEPIVIKGALNFSLKTIAKALYNNKLINSSWNLNSPCSNGLSALILANKLYDDINNLEAHIGKNKENIFKQPIMKDIIYYNEIDCKVMWEIHNYIKLKL